MWLRIYEIPLLGVHVHFHKVLTSHAICNVHVHILIIYGDVCSVFMYNANVKTRPRTAWSVHIPCSAASIPTT